MDVDRVPELMSYGGERTKVLCKKFEDHFGVEPDFCVRVPGRVNLIGEHIDYCGYPVLPMAIEQDTIVAAKRVKEPVLSVTNVQKKYPDYKGPISILRRAGSSSPEWYEYVLCGVIGARDLVNVETEPHGLLLAVSGNIPPAAGLSSSSALVCASSLACVHSNQMKISKSKMATLCCCSERLIGTNGGGMDQAIAFLAQEGCAHYITWDPLVATPVSLPDGAVFVIANSLVEANKAATDDYNVRVKECTTAAKLIASAEGLSDALNVDRVERLTLATVQRALNFDLDRMLESVGKLPELVGTLKVRARATHVIEEAIRVDRFRRLCGESLHVDEWETRLGGLMRASHRSLSELYECSHQSLDRMVDLSDEFGVHARLTGAGWGGCIVALCTKDKARPYIDMMVEKYYKRLQNIDKYNLSEVIFMTSPKQGAFTFSP